MNGQLPATGVFEDVDYEIVAWRDYYDTEWLRAETVKAQSDTPASGKQGDT